MTNANSNHSTQGAQFQHQPELRALLVLDRLPPDHLSFMVDHDRFRPHLRRGEFAIVDTADVEPMAGEIFVIAYESLWIDCGHRLELVEVDGRMERRSERGWEMDSGLGEPEIGWRVHHQSKSSIRLAREIGEPPETLSGGLYRTDHLRSKLIGRVVAVMNPRPGGRCHLAAGDHHA